MNNLTNDQVLHKAKRMYKFVIIALGFIFLFSCAPKYKPVKIYKIPGKRRYYIKYSEVGYASWYGKKFHGRPTASGEIYDMYKLTAAHKKLPLGTYVKVTNLSNGKSVIVKINDRGPYVRGRIIDLSYAAAKKIGMVKKGVQKVKIVAIKYPYYIKKYKNIFAYRKIFSVQVGSYRFKNNAKIMMSTLKRFTKKTFYRKVKINGDLYYRVYAGSYSSKKAAKRLLAKLLRNGFDGFIVEIDE